MKVRIQANSIRVRLTQSEVRRIAGGSSVEQTTTFSPLAKLCSRVESSSQVEKPIATFENQYLTLSLPSNEARHWAESEEVGIETDQPVGDGTSLRIIIEKDFECLHPRGEEIADAFPRPVRAVDTEHR
jgi:hypothetical protein